MVLRSASDLEILQTDYGIPADEIPPPAYSGPDARAAIRTLTRL